MFAADVAWWQRKKATFSFSYDGGDGVGATFIYFFVPQHTTNCNILLRK